MADPEIDKLMESGAFPDETSAAYASAMFHNLNSPVTESLISGSKTYTKDNFHWYLLERCGVKLKDTETAVKTLKKLSY